MRTNIIRPILAICVLVGLAACGPANAPKNSSGDTAAQAPTPAAKVQSAPSVSESGKGGISAPFDLGKIMRQVRLAFRPERANFVGGGTTYDVSVEPSGEFSFTPIHHDSQTAGRLPFDRTKRILGAPARLKTLAAIVGATPLAMRPAALGQASDGHLQLTRGAFVEHLQNSEDGLEQSFSFAERPRGEGDLVLRVSLSGLSYAGETAQGLHFRDGATGLGLRYGLATWVDAKGARTALSTRFENGAITLRVPESTLAASAYPAVLDPLIGPEIGLNTPTTMASAGSPSLPAIAFGGSSYLIAWNETRVSDRDIYAARVSKEGALLDSMGFAVSQAVGDQTTPAIAFDGTNFLVVWEDARNATSSTSFNLDIYGARVSQGGTVLDPDGIAISTAPDEQDMPALAFDGTNYLVVWEDLRNCPVHGPCASTGIYGKRVGKSGTILDTQELDFTVRTKLLNYPQRGSAPSLLFDGVNYYMVVLSLFEDSTHYYLNYVFSGKHINPQGNVLDERILTGEGGDSSLCGIDMDLEEEGLSGRYCFANGGPSLAFDGTNYFATWGRAADGSTHALVHGVLISRSGESIVEKDLVMGSSGEKGGFSRVVFDGTDFFAVWTYSSAGSAQIYGARVATNGNLIDAMSIPITPVSSNQRYAALAFDGTNLTVAWQDDRLSTALGRQIYSTRLNTAAQRLDTNDLLVSNGPSDASAPAIAYDGTNYLVVWEDNRNLLTGGFDIIGTRVSPGGTVLDPMGITICNALDHQRNPAIAYTGSTYLVAWEDYRDSAQRYSDVYTARVSKAGTVQDANGIAAAGNTTDPDIGIKMTQTHLCYRKSINTYCYKLAADGTITSDSVNLGDYSVYSVASLPSMTLRTTISDNTYNYNFIHATSIFEGVEAAYSSSIIPLYIRDSTTIGISETLNTTTGKPQSGEFLIFLEGQALENDMYLFGSSLYVARASITVAYSSPTSFSVNVVVSDPIEKFSIGKGEHHHAATFDGTHVLLVWEDSDVIRGSFLNPDGTVLDPLGVVFSEAGEVASAPALSNNGAGVFLLTYSAKTASGATIKARSITWTATGSACTKAGDCASGFCVDGYCCDTACTGTCSACSNARTGQANGACAAITDGTDPDDECDNNASCLAWWGKPNCVCKNRFQGNGKTCVACAPGTVSMGLNTICTKCDAGTYQSDNTCIYCPSGTTSKAGSSACSTTCEAGYYVSGVACLPCAAGTYSSAPNRTTCMTCPAYYTSEAGAATCHPKCGDGTVISPEACDDDNTTSGDGCNSTCSAVEAGYHCPAEGGYCYKDCTIGGVVYAFGARNPNNPCESCDPFASTTQFTPEAYGIPCTDDGLACTADVCDGQGACVHRVGSGCLIDGACIQEGAADPQNSCQACQGAVSASSYTAKAANSACTDDGLACTADVCDGQGICTHTRSKGCLIDGACFEAGASNPAAGKSCEGCAPGVSADSWTPHIPGYPCADDGYLSTTDICDGKGTCLHPKAQRCQINDVNYWDGTLDPTNDCKACQTPISTTSYTARPYGAPCASDNDAATLDLCDGLGHCLHTTQADCTINGTTYAGGASPEANICLLCNPSLSRTSWDTRSEGYPCADDGDPCTTDACNGYGECQHTASSDPGCATPDGDSDSDTTLDGDSDGDSDGDTTPDGDGSDADSDAPLTDGDLDGETEQDSESVTEDGDTESETWPSDGDTEDAAESDSESSRENEQPEIDNAEKDQPETDGESIADGDKDADTLETDPEIDVPQGSSGGGCQSPMTVSALWLLIGLFGLIPLNRRRSV